jgi:hypothetical protein
MRAVARPSMKTSEPVKLDGDRAPGGREWQQAHEIVQAERSNLAAWLHGIVHTLEGDLDNARYWYRRAGRDFPGRDAVQQEIAAARRKVTR